MLSLDLEGPDPANAFASATRAEDGSRTDRDAGGRGFLRLRKWHPRKSTQILPANYSAGLLAPPTSTARRRVGYVRLVPSQDLAVASSVSRETLGAVKVRTAASSRRTPPAPAGHPGADASATSGLARFILLVLASLSRALRNTLLYLRTLSATLANLSKQAAD